MINAHRTGAYISSLRKARDWTQLQLAEKLLRKHPKYIVILAPFCTYVLTDPPRILVPTSKLDFDSPLG